MKHLHDINDAFAYLNGDLSASERIAFEDELERSDATRQLLDTARQARGVWSTAHAAVQDISEARRSEVDERVLRAVMQDAPHPQPTVWTTLFGGGRAFVWAGAAAVLAVALVIGLQDRTAAPEQPVAAAEPLPPEVGERGAIYTAGRDVRKVTVAEAMVSIQPEGACEVTRLGGAVTQLDVIAGAVHFAVDKRAPGHSFRVTSGDVLVKVVGTAFTVDRVDDEHVTVSVDHGVVAVSRAGESRATLRAGETLTVVVVPPDVAANDHAHDERAHRVEPVQPAAAPTDPERDGGESAGADGVADEVAAVEAAVKSTVSRPVARRATRRAARRTSPPAAVVDPPAPPVVEATPPEPEAKTPPERAPVVETPEPTDDAGRELRSILSRIGAGNDAAVIGELKAWRRANRGHPGSLKARYAIGYCLFKLGDRTSAIRIFESVASRKNPWVNTAGDYVNPPRPR